MAAVNKDETVVPSAASTVVDGPLSDAEKDVERGAVAAAEDEAYDRDPHAVDWDGPDDPENPMNWPFGRKAAAVGIVSAITFIRYDVALKTLIGNTS